MKVRDSALQKELADALLVFSELQFELETLGAENRQLRKRASMALRHAAFSLLIAIRGDIAKISRQMGHATVAVTLGVQATPVLNAAPRASDQDCNS